MPAPRHHRPLSALWIGALAVAGAWGALGGDGIGSGPGAQATQLALAAGFVPDESSLPASPGPSGGVLGDAEGPGASAPVLQAPSPERKLAHTPDAIPDFQWNGRGDQRWTLADGRTFVVSAWGATWWLARDGHLRRTRLDLSGHDPARPARYVDGVGLLLSERDGGTRVVDLSGAEPVARVVPPGHPF